MEMTRDNLLNFVQSGMKRDGLSIAGLEKQSGVPKDTVRDFLRGKTQILRADKMQKILNILEPRQTLVIEGYVGDGGEIFPLQDGPQVVCPPGFAPEDVKAVRISGDAMFPVFNDGWIVYYSLRNAPAIPAIQGGWQVPYNPGTGVGTPSSSTAPFSEFIGKPCIVSLADGRIMLRTLKNGTIAEHYNLVSYNAPLIENAAIRWAAKIIFIKTE